MQPRKPQVGRYRVIDFIVLRKQLQQDFWRERVRQPQAHQIGRKVTAWHGQVEIVVVIGKLGAEFLANAVPDSRYQRNAVTAKSPADGDAHVKIKWLRLIASPHKLYFCLIVGAWLNGHAGDNIEWLLDAFRRNIESGVNFSAGVELPVGVNMNEAGFLEAVEIPEAAIRNMRANLEQVPEIIRTNSSKDTARNLPISATGQKTDLRIEVFTDLGIANAVRPVGIVVIGVKGKRIITAC